jgi:protein FAM50
VEHLFRGDARKARKRKKTAKATLSFAMDDEGDDENGEVNGGSSTPNGEDDDHPVSKRSKLKKNPNVDTSFLPDRDREEAERKERERLRLEWLAKQESIKKDEIEIVYSYWDGSGHRKSVMVSGLRIFLREIALTLYSKQCKKGDEIGSFLEKCRAQFPELRGVSVDNLMYVKVCLLNPVQCCLVNTGYLNSRKTLLYLMYDLSCNTFVCFADLPR